MSGGELLAFSPNGFCPAAMTPLDLPSDGSLDALDLPSTGGLDPLTFALPGAPYFMLITQPSGVTGIPAQPGSSINPIMPITRTEPPPPPGGGGLPTYKGGSGSSGSGGGGEAEF